jgi:hypothetical protein
MLWENTAVIHTFRKIRYMKLTLYLSITFCLTSFSSALAQEAEVQKMVETLFVAMEKGDSALARTTFDSEVTTASIFKDKNGKAVVRREEGVSEFLKAIGTPHAEVWYEEIWNVKVQVDGDFAQLWCDYAFYVGKNFSHCGVDAIQLYKTADGWKIFHLADTRRKAPCNVPDEIKKKHL